MRRPAAWAARATVLVLALSVAGCAGQAGSIELRVAAAASLRVAIAHAASTFESGNPGTTITIATDSSAALRTQVEQGAPYDVFLSADAANAQVLADGGLVAGDPVPFAANRVSLVVPPDNPAGIESPADLARPGLRIIAAAAPVPITGYATRVVDRLAGLEGYPAGFASAYAANVVSREDNVAAVLAKISLGEGDAGFVYATDAAASSSIVTIPIPDTANVVASYLGVVVAATDHRAAAAAFLTWLAGPEGQAVLAGFGFVAPS